MSTAADLLLAGSALNSGTAAQHLQNLGSGSSEPLLYRSLAASATTSIGAALSPPVLALSLAQDMTIDSLTQLGTVNNGTSATIHG